MLECAYHTMKYDFSDKVYYYVSVNVDGIETAACKVCRSKEEAENYMEEITAIYGRMKKEGKI